MPDVATSVRITGDARDVLDKLSDRLKQPKAQVIEQALRELEERLFWEETTDAFSRIAADAKLSAEQPAEIELWDKGTARDYRGEEW